MSLQSNVGKVMYDLRDVLTNDVTTQVISFSQDGVLTQEEVQQLVKLLRASVYKTFDKGTDAVLKVLG